MVYHAPQGRPASRPPMEYHGDIVLGRDCELAATQKEPEKSHRAGAGQKVRSPEEIKKRAMSRARQERRFRSQAAKMNAIETAGVWMTTAQACHRFSMTDGAVSVASSVNRWRKAGNAWHRIYLVPHDYIAKRDAMASDFVPQRAELVIAAPVEPAPVVEAVPPRRSIWLRLFEWVIGR